VFAGVGSALLHDGFRAAFGDNGPALVPALGPEGGNKGGTLVAEGSPETVMKKRGSFTGEHLARALRQSN